MGKLSANKKKKLIIIEEKRYEINNFLENGFITEEDIMSLASKDINYGVKNEYRRYDYKEAILKDIFNCPFLLCDQKNLSLKIKEILPIFLKARYETEKEMLDLYLKQAYITQDEYNNEIDELDFVYYRSSNDGKNIQKEGKLLLNQKDFIKKSFSTIDYDKVNENFKSIQSSVNIIGYKCKLKIITNKNKEFIIENYEMLNQIIDEFEFPIKIKFINIRLGIIKRIIEFIKQNKSDIRTFIKHNDLKNSYEVLFLNEKEIKSEEGIQKLKTLK